MLSLYFQSHEVKRNRKDAVPCDEIKINVLGGYCCLFLARHP